ncbi:hypothetical protein KK103_11865 [Curtobacterium flaccumfaciens pv. flaccumfaciens]|uniref:Uncharacterized protein n=1 Tax=Curtobacterium flaccumfaciens pv. flaccumfaciens TaxID=138532 RepID=A0A9Q2W6I8_9MICO|nr:hypothetical protein [Curtobacterium flaccumfaciens]MBT1542461.1 hypothetical protein [Curtobacterium flaccumfaciens pv. flaccumfaciens]
MTAITPQQMRQQADKTESVAEGLEHMADRVVLRRSAAALHAAADQLEAVPAQREAFLDSPNLDPVWVAGWHAAIDHVTHSLAAGTAPQGDRDD